MTLKDLVQRLDDSISLLINDRDYSNGIRCLYKGPAKELQEFLDREIYWVALAGLDTLLIEI